MKKYIITTIWSLFISIFLVFIYDFLRKYFDLASIPLFFIAILLFLLLFYKILEIPKQITICLIIFSIFVSISFYAINTIEAINNSKYYCPI